MSFSLICSDVARCVIRFLVRLASYSRTGVNSDYGKDLRIWAMLTLLAASFFVCVVLVWASLVRRWGALWLLTSSPHSPPCSSPSSLLSLPLGVTDADGPAGSSHSSHIKVLLSTSANGAYNVKQSARWGGEKVPLRSPQHSSHNAPPSSSPTPLNNTPSSVHRPLN